MSSSKMLSVSRSDQQPEVLWNDPSCRVFPVYAAVFSSREEMIKHFEDHAEFVTGMRLDERRNKKAFMNVYMLCRHQQVRQHRSITPEVEDH